MKIVIGADHRGFEYKKQLLKLYPDWVDVGAHTPDRSDYPVFAQKVASTVQNKNADGGILLCGTGIGMAIAANRFKKIYAGIVWNEEIARLAKEHDNINILIIPVDFVSFEIVESIIKTWMNTRFLEGRYAERLSILDE